MWVNDGKNKQILRCYLTLFYFKEELERANLRVWIDVEDIHGSSLESMARAVEDAECVLVCMTEKYKQSPNCRAEAEYAFNLKKPIVPLIMQASYRPDGWLGIILGSKIFIDFNKYEFAECVRRLKKELASTNGVDISHNNYVQKPFNISNPAAFVEPQMNSKPTSAKNEWSEDQVSKWAEEKQFNQLILENILPCDGSLLEQMFHMYINSPEFFYGSLNVNGKLNLKDTALFTRELKKLFE